jgi:hypothetical protein
MSEQQAEIDADVQAEEADIVRINAAVALVLTEIQKFLEAAAAHLHGGEAPDLDGSGGR